MNKKIWLLGIISLIICLLIVADTYALFETNASGTNELEIGRWNIMVNGQDASLYRTITLNDFTYSTNSHTESDYFAPGRSAQFDLEIDTSSSDVSVMYDITIDDSELLNHPNIYFTIRDMDEENSVNDNNYNGIIYLNATNRVKIIRITLNWNNETEYDELDTSLIDGTLSFNIAANFKQYIEE